MHPCCIWDLKLKSVTCHNSLSNFGLRNLNKKWHATYKFWCLQSYEWIYMIVSLIAEYMNHQHWCVMKCECSYSTAKTWKISKKTWKIKKISKEVKLFYSQGKFLFPLKLKYFLNTFDKTCRIIAGWKFWINISKWFLLYLRMKKITYLRICYYDHILSKMSLETVPHSFERLLKSKWLTDSFTTTAR